MHVALLSVALALPAQQAISQVLDDAPRPAITSTDDVGVDLFSGKAARSMGMLSLGRSEAPDVEFGIFSTSWIASGRTPFYGRMDQQCQNMSGVQGCVYWRNTYNMSGDAEFTSYPPYPGNVQGFTLQGSLANSNVVYRKDGSLWTFINTLPGMLSTVTYPDGTTYTFNYSGAYLRSIVSNRGYMMHIQGFQPLPFSHPSKVVLINLNTDYCAPLATNCTGLTVNWPSVTFAHDNSAPTKYTYATDHLNRVSTKSYINSAHVTANSYTRWTTTFKYTSPGGNWFEFERQNQVWAGAIPPGQPCSVRGSINWFRTAAGTWNYSFLGGLNGCYFDTIYGGTSTGPDGATQSYDGGHIDGLNRKHTIAPIWYSDMFGSALIGVDSITKPENDMFDYGYDARRNLTQTLLRAKTGPATISATASFPATCTTATYKTCNKPDYTIDANGNRTDYTYYPHGAVHTITLPPDKVGPTGVRPQIRHTYVQKSARYKSSASSYVLGSAIWVLDTTTTCKTGATCAGTAEEVITSYTYNDNLLPVTVTTRDGTGAILSTVTRGYDVFGNVTSVDGAEPGTADTYYYFFDGARRETGEIGPDPDGSGPLPRPARRRSFNLDNLVTREDVGTATATTQAALDAMSVNSYVESNYDGLGRLSKQITVAGGVSRTVMQFSHDARSRVQCTAVRMNPATFASLPASACDHSTPVGPYGPDRISRNVYDAAGQVVQVVQGEGTADRRAYVTRTYTGNGRVQDTIDANGNRSRQTYDAFDRPLDFFYPSPVRPQSFDSSSVAQALATSGSHNPNDFEHLAYDNKKNVTSWKRRDNTLIGYEYDPLDRQVVKNLPNGTAQDVFSGYDLLGNVVYRRFDSHAGSGVTYSYDGIGRVKTATDMNGRTVGYQFTASSVRKRLTFPGGDYIGSTLDGLNRLTDLGWNADSGLIGRTYDTQGDLIRITKGSGETRYGYDPLGNLTSQTNDLAGTENDITWSFIDHNPALQVQTREASSDRFDFRPVAAASSQTHDGLNRLSSIVALPGGYDPRQNLASDGTRTFTFDLENRLLTATGAGASLTLTYDPEGRIARYSVASTHTSFLYDGDTLIAEYDESGNLQRRYVHGPGADNPLVWLEGSGIADARYLYANRQGSIVASANGAGGMLGLYKYGPFGEPRDANDVESWTGPRFRYTGQLSLPEAKLYHYKARAYDPVIGRFLQTDPIGTSDDQNLYGYVGGDPLNAADPTGTQAVLFTPPPTTPVGIRYLLPLSRGPVLRPITQGVRTAIQQSARASGEFVKTPSGLKIPRMRPSETGQQYLQRLTQHFKDQAKYTANRPGEELPTGPVRYLERLDFFNKFGDYLQGLADLPFAIVIINEVTIPHGTVTVEDMDGNEIPPMENESSPSDNPGDVPVEQPDPGSYEDHCTKEDYAERRCA
jgi:RHS repeat-associated protein